MEKVEMCTKIIEKEKLLDKEPVCLYSMGVKVSFVVFERKVMLC